MMNRFAFISLALLLAATLPTWSLGQPTYTVTRLNGGQPLITQQTFTDVDPAFTGQGANINGPSVIRVPDWIAAADRPDPSARYYMYFADHDGAFIRMAWSDRVDGQYQLFGQSTLSENKPRGVLDMGASRRINLANNLQINGHIASPDVHVDDAAQRITLYFHGPTNLASTPGSSGNQKTFVAHSSTGLDFNGGIEPVSLGFAYMRVFDYMGRRYGIASRGAVYQAPDDPTVAPDGFDYRQDLWTLAGSSVNDNPFQADIDADPDGPVRLRHSSVRVVGDTLQVFHTRVGDTPERILLTTLDLSAGDFTQWDPIYPPEELLRPALDWEGVDQPLTASSPGAEINVQQLRDPYVFSDTDGQLYLFYTGEGEEAIGIARLDVVPEPSSLLLVGVAIPLLIRRRTLGD